jgi:prevent-host-death family protein
MKATAGRVGVRELRQGLSIYLKRVRAGEALEVTDRGRSVAVLAPLPSPATALDRLVAGGRARPVRGSLVELGPPKGRATRRASRALQRERADRT